ncbi:hypothetical protein CDD83_3472 [Cordyceps sp. RAO-2017]|nr:hypothetical protein CDD83_3472 [Cordyceps sp. RAO-2017]
MRFAIFAACAATFGAAAAAPACQPDSSVAAAGQKPSFFLIRHAEKNQDGTISAQGMQREQCLVKVFGRDSKYDIRHIMVQTPHPGECAGQAALRYNGPGNVLIAWEHHNLRKVSEAIGGKDVPKYPGSQFDLIYNQPSPYREVTVTSEECPGLDSGEY